MDHEKENPSAANAGAQSNSVATFKLASTIPSAADILARARRHDYGLLVTYERRDGRVASQVYAGNIAAAEQKVRRCHRAGLAATMTLVRLVPVVGSTEVGDAE